MGGQLFKPKVIAALVAAGIFAFVAFVLFSVYADNFRPKGDGRGHALSNSAIGFSGIVKLVELAGGKSRLLRSESRNDSDDLMVIVLEPQSGVEAIEELMYSRPKQPVLVVLPKWIATNDPAHRGWVRIHDAGMPSPIASLFEGAKVETDTRHKGGGLSRGRDLLEGVDVPIPAKPQTIYGPNLVPMLSGPGGGALLARLKDNSAGYILADPDLMNNHGLKDPRVAGAALQILARLNLPDAKSVVFDISLNGFGRNPSAFKLAFEPPFVTLTIALFLAALLAGLHGAFRFGPSRREERAIPFGKLALVENSAGLIQQARREHLAGSAYAELVRESAAHASGAPASLQGEALDSYLDRLAPEDAVPFSSLASDLRDAKSRDHLIRAARALFQWKKDYIR